MRLMKTPQSGTSWISSKKRYAPSREAGLSYAMDNAPQNVKDAADRVAPACTEDGVLQILEELL
jgi:hypothetical protein